MVKQMRPGSMIVDTAIETGGNVECSKYDEEVEINGVSIHWIRQSARTRRRKCQRDVLEQPLRVRRSLLGQRRVRLGPDQRNFEGMRDYTRRQNLQRNNSKSISMKKESGVRSQETGAPNGQANVKNLEEDHVRRIAMFSEKLQELQNKQNRKSCPGPDFLKRGVFGEVEKLTEKTCNHGPRQKLLTPDS